MVIKEAVPQDIDNILEWTKDHMQYEQCFGYPNTVILKAEDEKGEPVIYGVLYPGVIVEGFGMKPGINAREWIDGVGSLLNAYKAIAASRGITDLVFFCGANAEHLEKYAKKHGFYLEKSHVYRLLLAAEANDVREQVSDTSSAGSNAESDKPCEYAGREG